MCGPPRRSRRRPSRPAAAPTPRSWPGRTAAEACAPAARPCRTRAGACSACSADSLVATAVEGDQLVHRAKAHDRAVGAEPPGGSGLDAEQVRAIDPAARTAGQVRPEDRRDRDPSAEEAEARAAACVEQEAA